MKLLTAADEVFYRVRGSLHQHGLASSSLGLLGEFSRVAAQSVVLDAHFDISTIWEDIKQKAEAADKWTRLRTYMRLIDSGISAVGPNTFSLFLFRVKEELRRAGNFAIDRNKAEEDLRQAERFYRKFSSSDVTKEITAKILQSFATDILKREEHVSIELRQFAQSAIDLLKVNGDFKEAPTRKILSLKPKVQEPA